MFDWNSQQEDPLASLDFTSVDSHGQYSDAPYENNGSDGATLPFCMIEDDSCILIPPAVWADMRVELPSLPGIPLEQHCENGQNGDGSRSDYQQSMMDAEPTISEATYVPSDQPPSTEQSSARSLKHQEDSKNVLINVGTQLKNFFEHRYKNTKTLQTFYQLFGRRKTYKSLRRFSNLFGSAELREICIEFFDHYALSMILRSKSSRKSSIVKYLGVLRQGAIHGTITNLTFK